MTRAKSQLGNEFVSIATKVSKNDKAKIETIANKFGMSIYELLQSLLLGMLRYFDIDRHSTYEHNCMMDALFIVIRSLRDSYSPIRLKNKDRRKLKSAILFIEDSPKNRPQLISVRMNGNKQMMESLNYDKMISDFLGCIDPESVQKLDSLRKELGYFSITHTLHEIIRQRTSPIDENVEYINEMFKDTRIPSGQSINDDIMYKRGKRQSVDEYTTITKDQTFRADI